MRRRWCSQWAVSGLSLAVGTGLGVAVSGLWSSSSTDQSDQRLGLLARVPMVPIPSLEAHGELEVYQGGGAMAGGRPSPGAVMKYGFPSLANIKTRESYVTSYDPRTRTASWVIEQLNPASLTGTSDRNYSEFKEDDSSDQGIPPRVGIWDLYTVYTLDLLVTISQQHLQYYWQPRYGYHDSIDWHQFKELWNVVMGLIGYHAV